MAILPLYDTSLGSLTLPVPEAGDFVKLIMLCKYIGQAVLSVRLANQYVVCICLLLHACHMLAHLTRLDMIVFNNIVRVYKP